MPVWHRIGIRLKGVLNLDLNLVILMPLFPFLCPHHLCWDWMKHKCKEVHRFRGWKPGGLWAPSVSATPLQLDLCSQNGLAFFIFPFPSLSAPQITPYASPGMGIHSTVLAAELLKKENSAKNMQLKKKNILLVIAVGWVKNKVKKTCPFPSIATFPHPIQSSAVKKLVHPSRL